MMTKDNLQKISEELKKLSQVRAFAIVSRDGLILESGSHEDISDETLASRSASMFNGVEMVLSGMMDGAINRTIAESDTNRLIVMSSGSATMLVVVTDLSDNLDDTLKEIEKTNEKIREVMG